MHLKSRTQPEWL